jgi:predicted ATP-grasp superfamily ATP-dependent carboligase
VEKSRVREMFRIVVKKGITKNDFAETILITGFHGIGECGYIAATQLIEALQAERIGMIESDALPSFVAMQEDRLSLPYELYFFEGKKDKFIVILTNFQPNLHELNYFCKGIVDWAVSNKFKEAFLIGGLDNRFQKDGDRPYRCVLTQKYKERAKKLDTPLLERGLYVTGPLALLLAYFEMEDFPAIAVLPYGKRDRPDPRAASIAVEEFSKLYNIEIDVSGLLKDAQKIEEELEEMLRQQQEKMMEDARGPTDRTNYYI